MAMERIVNISDNHEQAREYEILQQLKMTSIERQMAARELKKKFYGEKTPDVRKSRAWKVS